MMMTGGGGAIRPFAPQSLAGHHHPQRQPEVVGRVRARDLRNFSNDAYYRVTGPGEYLDTYAQDPRPAGGDHTRVRVEQTVRKPGRSLPPLNENANNSRAYPQLQFHGCGENYVGIPACVMESG